MKTNERPQKRIIILGNGFDLDLGLATSYRNFLESEHFQKLGKRANLFYWLLSKHEFQSWTDIEEELRLFAVEQSHRKSHFSVDLQKHFNALTNALCEYLNSINYDCIKKDSMPSVLAKCINGSDCFDIYDYNYTDLEKIFKKLNYEISGCIHHVHGKAVDKSIILGFEDDVDIDAEYNFMIKTFSPHYRSHQVQCDLEDAGTVIFFGHSLSSTDYRYFTNFFHKQSSIDLERKCSKKIVIVTYDEKSRLKILQQLWEMNDKRIGFLFDQNEFSIYRTSVEDDRKKLSEFLEFLRNIYNTEQNM